MIERKKAKDAGKARLNKARRAAQAFLDVSAGRYPSMDNALIADLRAHVEDITQCFHEFNAYWNMDQAANPQVVHVDLDTEHEWHHGFGKD
jgi:hypothetical protein